VPDYSSVQLIHEKSSFLVVVLVVVVDVHIHHTESPTHFIASSSPSPLTSEHGKSCVKGCPCVPALRLANSSRNPSASSISPIPFAVPISILLQRIIIGALSTPC
jgi:hypothetical protein